MKKRMKGLISWWLVFAMLFSSVSVSFATESAEAQKTTAEYYIGSNSLDSSYTVEYGETTDLSLYYGDGAATLTDQVSNLEEENRPENKILLGWKLWGVHYYGDLDAGPIEKSLTDVVTAEDVTTCLNNSDNYYNPLIEPHYVDKYIIDPQPTNETFTVGGKEYNIDDCAYYETTDVTYQWHLWETVPYTVVSTVEDESNEIKSGSTNYLSYKSKHKQETLAIREKELKNFIGRKDSDTVLMREIVAEFVERGYILPGKNFAKDITLSGDAKDVRCYVFNINRVMLGIKGGQSHE